MRRALTADPIDDATLAAIVDAGLRAPSAGFTQAVTIAIAREPESRAQILAALTTPGWLAARPEMRGLERAPALLLVTVDPAAYAERYGAPDKRAAGLSSLERWPIPYWWVDAGATLEAILVAATALDIGAAVIGTFRGEDVLRDLAGLTQTSRIVITVALGHPLPEPVHGSPSRRGRLDPRDRVVPLDLQAQRLVPMLRKLQGGRSGGA